MHILLNAVQNGLLPSVILKRELQMWLNEKKPWKQGYSWNVISKNTWHCFVNDVTKHVFLNGEGLQTLILGIVKNINSVNRKYDLYDILLAIQLTNKSREPFPFIYRFVYNVNTQLFITFSIASEIYLKELVALLLSFLHVRVNVLTINCQLSVTWPKFELLICLIFAKAIKLYF